MNPDDTINFQLLDMSITREFLRSPLLTGAIAPSSPALAQAMAAGLGLHRANVVVEL